MLLVIGRQGTIPFHDFPSFAEPTAMTLLDRLLNKPTYPVPDKGSIQKINQETKYTNDAWWLERFEYLWLFVYDRMMSNIQGDVEGVKIIPAAYTKRNYLLTKKTLGPESYPIALRSNPVINRPSWADPIPGEALKIKGELWLIKPQVFKELDEFYNNGEAFLRKRITVVVPHHRKHLTYGDEQDYPFAPGLAEVNAYTYVGNPEVWWSLIRMQNAPLFRACRPYVPHNKLLLPYYFFSPLEFNEE